MAVSSFVLWKNELFERFALSTAHLAKDFGQAAGEVNRARA
jgi:hypothetical protein